MHKFSYLLLVLVILSFASCNSQAKKEHQADEMLQQIEQLIGNKQYTEAKQEIDSLHKTYPLLVAKRKIAAALKDTIARRESAEILEFSTKALPVNQHKLDSLQKNFRYSKNEKYEETGNYVYKTQISEQNTSRNYLKYYVDDNGILYLESDYTGRKINQYGIKLTSQNLSVATDTLNRKGVFNSFNDGSSYYESLTFENKDENGLLNFIISNINHPIKVTLLGDKNVSYLLSDVDKKAIAATNEFWTVKRDVVKLEKDILKAQVKIGNIKLRYSIQTH